MSQSELSSPNTSAPETSAERNFDRAGGVKKQGATLLRRGGPLLLTLPALALLTIFFLAPMVDVVVRSFTDPEPGIGNYIWLVTTKANLTVMVRTFATSIVVTVLCLVLAYPYAYLMLIVGNRARNLLQLVIMLPLWTSILVRTFAWMVLLQDTGPINALLQVIGIGPVPLIRTTFGVALGMSQILLPFIVLPLYASMSGINRTLLSAAATLGAKPIVRFFTVFLPLTRPGIIAGSVTVMVLGLGFYIIPALLGSPNEIMISALIEQQISTYLLWGQGTTLGVSLLVITVLILVLFRRSLGSGAQIPAMESK